jgi:ribosomal protein L12E/L44/L45/RPP1/RPP2
MEEEDDDFYAPSEPVISTPSAHLVIPGSGATVPKEEDELEEGEEEEEEEEEEEVESDSVLF